MWSWWGSDCCINLSSSSCERQRVSSTSQSSTVRAKCSWQRYHNPTFFNWCVVLLPKCCPWAKTNLWSWQNLVTCILKVIFMRFIYNKMDLRVSKTRTTKLLYALYQLQKMSKSLKPLTQRKTWRELHQQMKNGQVFRKDFLGGHLSWWLSLDYFSWLFYARSGQTTTSYKSPRTFKEGGSKVVGREDYSWDR